MVLFSSYGWYPEYRVVPETSGLPKISGNTRCFGLHATRWFLKLNRVGYRKKYRCSGTRWALPPSSCLAASAWTRRGDTRGRVLVAESLWRFKNVKLEMARWQWWGWLQSQLWWQWRGWLQWQWWPWCSYIAPVSWVWWHWRKYLIDLLFPPFEEDYLTITIVVIGDDRMMTMMVMVKKVWSQLWFEVWTKIVFSKIHTYESLRPAAAQI